MLGFLGFVTHKRSFLRLRSGCDFRGF